MPLTPFAITTLAALNTYLLERYAKTNYPISERHLVNFLLRKGVKPADVETLIEHGIREGLLPAHTLQRPDYGA